MNAVFAACGMSGSCSVRAIRIAKLRAVRAADEPLVAVDDPLVAVGVGPRLDERRVGSRDLGLGHREARAGDAVAQRLQVLLLLLVGAPVQQRVHVALVGRLRVDGERAEARCAPPRPAPSRAARGRAPCRPTPSACAGSHEPRSCAALRISTMPSMRLLRSFASMRVSIGRTTSSMNVAHLRSDLFELGGEAEVDGHARSVVRP